MASLIASVNTGKIALAASTVLTVLQIAAPANHRVKILRWGVFFDEETGDVTPAQPLLVEVGRISGATGGTAASLEKVQPGAETVQSVALTSMTGGTLVNLDSAVVNPQTGYEVIYPLGQEVIMAGGEIFAVRVTPGAVISTDGLNALTKVWIEE